MAIRIFIGSSQKHEAHARELLDLIEDANEPDVEVIGWWQLSTFQFGESFLASLERAMADANAALMLAAPDDFVIKKDDPGQQPRDNVTLEYGMAVGWYGRKRCALAVLPDESGKTPLLPSDVAGIKQIVLTPKKLGKEFREANRRTVRAWIAQLREIPLAPIDQIRESFPTLHQALEQMLEALPAMTGSTKEVDRFSGDLVAAVVKLFRAKDYGFGEMYAELVKRDLKRCNSIYALDVLGPSAWIGPYSFGYLSLQLWQYLIANTAERKLTLRVSEALAEAIERALALSINPPFEGVANRRKLSSSNTDFDTKRDIDWIRDEPVTEYARILLWSREELLSPLAEGVIAIHEAFHVPLFFRETNRDDELRNFDYLLFREAGTTGEVFGFVSEEQTQFNPRPVGRQGAKLIGHFYDLLRDETLMFAIDARHYLRQT